MDAIDDLRSVVRMAMRQGDWRQVHESASKLAALDEADDGVHFVLGRAAMELGWSARSLGHLERALVLRPDSVEYRIHAARALVALCRFHDALAICDDLFDAHPTDALIADTVGVIRGQCGMHAMAGVAFERAVAIAPNDCAFRFNHAIWLGADGALERSDDALEACISRCPDHWQAHYSLAISRRQTQSRNHLPRLRNLLERTRNNPVAQLYLGAALAKELDDLDRCDESFAHLAAAKASVRRRMNYQPTAEQSLFEAITDRFSGEDSTQTGFATQEPIFVLGMPRTGTTLVDRILSGHPDVLPAGELFNFPVACKEEMGAGHFNSFNPSDMRSTPDPDWLALGRRYLDSTRPITGTTPRFTDKLPQNYLYLGFMAKALPQARFVCVRRNAMDTCLANFRHVFALGSPYFNYSYDLLDAGRYYLRFDALMKHWMRVFPGRIHTVDYDALVASPEQPVRELLSFCDLSWNPSCLLIENNPRPVASASAPQVREAMHGRARHRWKAYRKHLEHLEQMFVDSGIVVGD